MGAGWLYLRRASREHVRRVRMGAAVAAVDGMAQDTSIRVIDNWGPPELIRAADATWPRLDWPHWHKYADAHSMKYGTKDADRLPKAAAMIVDRMAALAVGGNAFPDLDLHGAGLHCIPPGGFLGRHVDGAVHPLLGWKREVNAVLFVSAWSAEWGGELCFYDAAGTVVLRVEPAFNRLVLFETNDSWHGVEKVTGPRDRRTISLFWWSQQPVNSHRDRAEFKCTPA
ncbi:MAG: 2OG-Fe(II) oxygenase [Desulfurellales bacterium]|nr:MAG: 2OG-Fe(II) oxygenase [Desulfurellales bacterium]